MPEQQTYRWVAGPASADDAARSFARGSMRRRSSRLVLAGAWLFIALLVATTLHDLETPTARIGWGFATATVMMAIVFPVGLVLGRRITRRRLSRRIGPGTELTSRFGPSSFELAGPLSRYELSYADLEHVERVGDWVHLRQTASPVVLIWPAALFPDPELARMQRLVADRAGLAPF